MAGTKISDLTDGEQPASGDWIEIAREGEPNLSRKLSWDDIKSYLDSVAATLTNKDISNANNTYRAASTSLIGAVEEAVDAEVYAATANKSLHAGHLSSASAAVTLTHASPTALDWSAGIYRTWTMTGNVTLSNPTNGVPGTWRTIWVQGNSGTERTITFGNQYLGDLPTVADVTDDQPYLLLIFCHTSSIFYVSAWALF